MVLYLLVALLGSVALSSSSSLSFGGDAASRIGKRVDTPIPDPASRVNLFIGTTSSGHAFPGVTLPHGMVKVGMDTDSPDNLAGYDSNPGFNAVGFSQLHDDGTGGSVPLSLFKIWPFASCGDSNTFTSCPTDLNSRKVLRKTLSDGSPDDTAEPGYFASNLSTNIRVELTATRRTALHRYTFPSNATIPRLVVDATNDGQQSSSHPIVHIDSSTGRVTVGATFAASFGPGTYRAYACMDFKGDGFTLGAPSEFGTYLGNSPILGLNDGLQEYTGYRSELGALLGFAQNGDGTTTIFVRAGVSFISTDQACANAEAEIPDFDFDGTRTATRAAWNDLLGRIQVGTDNVDDDTIELFYSSLYRTHISPADYTGENPLWYSDEPYYDSFYCNWDTFRTLFPLMSLHDPENFARIVRGMINIQQHEGWLPECRGATAQHWIQGGSNGDPILGEFFVKYAYQAAALNVSADALYAALLADAEDQPPDWNLQGRQANVWKSTGYIPADLLEAGGANTKQVSRALEYAFGDFAVAQVAKLLNKTDDATKYAGRAANFVNHWNPNTTVPDQEQIVGMMQPRFQNGSFGFTDPRHCSVNDPTGANCFLFNTNFDGFYESSPVVYSQFAPQDTAKLVDLQGGPEAFISRLDFIFDQNYFDATDEPSQQIPFMYHYANAPGHSTNRSRQILFEHFSTATNGLPGNDDSGAMASYAAFYLAGLYPVPATRQYLLSSPFFPSISFFNPAFNSTTTIAVANFAGNPANGAAGTIFVQNVTIDGAPAPSNCFLDWDVFVRGATVELTLTDDMEVTCGGASGNGTDALPPSLSTGGFGF
ncbi:glycoside hydrolase family 92 protein [Epithele typhae]|uniref:glycoside hydrolase family 92 protein n=1 Tax=Epithele typhae TaxID=378194 RepID=UPI002007D009|nr:glycoside hydrolase family 92 protein [Epithele typhae]KAH9934470.1 glycoside hydrolase family 92 protein [Epithele typhae]